MPCLADLSVPSQFKTCHAVPIQTVPIQYIPCRAKSERANPKRAMPCQNEAGRVCRAVPAPPCYREIQYIDIHTTNSYRSSCWRVEPRTSDTFCTTPAVTVDSTVLHLFPVVVHNASEQLLPVGSHLCVLCRPNFKPC